MDKFILSRNKINLSELNVDDTVLCMIQMSDYAHFIQHQNKYLESDLVNVGIRIIFSSTFDYDTCRGMVSTFKEYLDMYRNSSDIRDKQYGIYTG